jgi:MFS transporter, putative metabolite:H+ symporter
MNNSFNQHSDKKTEFFDSIPLNKKQLRLIFLASAAFFFDLADNYNFGFIAPILVKRWHISLDDVAHVNAIFFVGMFLGGLLGGFISDKMGRKKAFLGSLLFFSLFSLLNGLAPNIGIFKFFRFLTGVGVASLVIISTPYLLEMLPKENRGKWQAIAVGIGCAAIPVIGLLVKLIVPLGENAWRIVYFFGATGILLFPLGLVWLKESPRWLVSKGHIREAEQVFKEITGYEADFSSSLLGQNKFSKKQQYKDFLQKKHLKNTILLLSIFAVAYPAGFIFINWTPTLYSQKGHSMDETLFLSMFISFGLVPGPFIASFLTDRLGRKKSILWLYGAAVLTAVLFGFVSITSFVIAIAVLLAILLQATNPISLAYIGELYPTHIRSTASGFVYSLGRLAIALVSLVVPLVNRNFGYSGVYVFMAILILITCVGVFSFGRETSGISLEEINNKNPINNFDPDNR